MNSSPPKRASESLEPKTLVSRSATPPSTSSPVAATEGVVDLLETVEVREKHGKPA
jgi:hypothetical protein